MNTLSGFFTSHKSHWEALPTDFVYTATCSLAFFLGIQLIAETICSNLVQSYNNLTKIEKKEFISRIVSDIHAIILFFVGGYLFFTTEEYYLDMNLLHSDRTTIMVTVSFFKKMYNI
jgi:hypothetical protein